MRARTHACIPAAYVRACMHSLRGERGGERRGFEPGWWTKVGGDVLGDVFGYVVFESRGIRFRPREAVGGGGVRNARAQERARGDRKSVV